MINYIVQNFYLSWSFLMLFYTFLLLIPLVVDIRSGEIDHFKQIFKRHSYESFNDNWFTVITLLLSVMYLVLHFIGF